MKSLELGWIWNENFKKYSIFNNACRNRLCHFDCSSAIINNDVKPSDVYMEYCAIRAHFERPQYDYWKYNGKLKVKPYDDRKDNKWFFRHSRMYNRQSLQEYYIANILAGNSWVGNMTNEAYMTWQKKIVRLSECYLYDLATIVALCKDKNIEPKEIFACQENEHPILFRLLLGDFIQLETFCILSQWINFLPTYQKKMVDDPIWNVWEQKIIKYPSFLKRYVEAQATDFRHLTKKELTKYKG